MEGTPFIPQIKEAIKSKTPVTINRMTAGPLIGARVLDLVTDKIAEEAIPVGIMAEYPVISVQGRLEIRTAIVMFVDFAGISWEKTKASVISFPSGGLQ